MKEFTYVDMQITNGIEAKAFLAVTRPIGRHVSEEIKAKRAQAMSIIEQENKANAILDKIHRVRQAIAHCFGKKLTPDVLRRFGIIAELHTLLPDSDESALEFADELGKKVSVTVDDLLEIENIPDGVRTFFEVWRKKSK